MRAHNDARILLYSSRTFRVIVYLLHIPFVYAPAIADSEHWLLAQLLIQQLLPPVQSTDYSSRRLLVLLRSSLASVRRLWR